MLQHRGTRPRGLASAPMRLRTVLPRRPGRNCAQGSFVFSLKACRFSQGFIPHDWQDSTNPLERLNVEIKRRTNAVGIFPHDASIVRWVGAMLLQQNDKWSLNRRCMQLEGLQTLSDTAPTRLCAVAR